MRVTAIAVITRERRARPLIVNGEAIEGTKAERGMTSMTVICKNTVIKADGG